MKLTDLHCHMMPYVDDGAQNSYEALQMLICAAESGVSTIVLTPHYRTKYFETPNSELGRQFERLQLVVSEHELPLKLLLGREYYYDDTVAELLLKRQVISFGKANCVLLEFSYHAPFSVLFDAVTIATRQGYRPILAHVERYNAVLMNPDILPMLRKEGALIQINAGSVIGQDGLSIKRFCRALMRKNVVNFIASDAHNMVNRKPNLSECLKYVERKMGFDYAQEIFSAHPNQVI